MVGAVQARYLYYRRVRLAAAGRRAQRQSELERCQPHRPERRGTHLSIARRLVAAEVLNVNAGPMARVTGHCSVCRLRVF